MTLAGYVAVLRRRMLILGLCVLAGVVGGFLQIHRTQKLYTATATYFVSLPSSDNADVTQNAVNVAESFLESFQTLATKRSTAEDVATAAGIDPSQVVNHLSSKVETGTFYVDVSATSPDPNLARRLADAAAQTVTGLIPKIQGSSKNPAGASVTDRALLPSSPTQPTPKRTLGLDAGLGLIVGLAVIALLEALDRSVRSGAEAAELAGAPMLGVVPKRKGTGQAAVVADSLREPYRALRAAVNFLNPDDPPITIMVTSPSPGDGKTTTAVNLATTMAEAGANVLLVDGDLRRAQLTRLFSLRRAPGMTSVVTREAELQDVVVKEGALFLLSSGPIPPNPSELLGSQSAVDLLEDARDRFDVVVIDAPPVLAVSDALVLAPHVDALLLVVRHGVTARAGVSEAQRRLVAVGQAPTAVIFNAVPRREAADYYGEYAYVDD